MPVRGETPVPRRLDAQRDSPAPRSGETPWPTGTWQTQAQAQPIRNAALLPPALLPGPA